MKKLLILALGTAISLSASAEIYNYVTQTYETNLKEAPGGKLKGDRLPPPGYAWQYPDDVNSLAVQWTPGLVHTHHYAVMAGKREGVFQPAPGYIWAGPNPAIDLKVVWKPWMPHPSYINVVASEDENRWEPGPGYDWVSNDKADRRVVWTPGIKVRGFGLIAHRREGNFIPQRGYKWKEGDPVAEIKIERRLRDVLKDSGYFGVRTGDLAGGARAAKEAEGYENPFIELMKKMPLTPMIPNR